MNFRALKHAFLFVFVGVGAITLAAILTSKRGWLFLPLYGGAVWAVYFFETKGKDFILGFLDGARREYREILR